MKEKISRKKKALENVEQNPRKVLSGVVFSYIFYKNCKRVSYDMVKFYG